MSHWIGNARPPAASIAAAALWIVPGNFGFATADFAATTTFAPSPAARNAIASPMPREAPVMNRVLPCRSVIESLQHRSSQCNPAVCSDTL